MCGVILKVMKILGSSLIILAFISVSIFSILAVGHEIGHGICFLTANTGLKPPCPEKDPLGFLNFHINIFKSFSTATFLNNLFAIISILSAFLIALIIAALAFSYKKIAVKLQKIADEPPEKLASQKTLFWLALHENSPAII